LNQLIICEENDEITQNRHFRLGKEANLLPFLKKSQETSASNSDPVEREADEGDIDSLKVAADELIHALDSKDGQRVASALKAFVELCDLEPHEEGPHT
jgi:hypothetical protein